MQVQKEARRQRGRDRKFASSMRMESEGQGFGSVSGRGRGTGRMQLVDLTECDSSFQGIDYFFNQSAKLKTSLTA